MSGSPVYCIRDCHYGNTDASANSKPACKQRRDSLNPMLNQKPEPKHSGAANNHIGEAIKKIRHAGDNA